MRKFLLISLVAVLGFAACSKDEQDGGDAWFGQPVVTVSGNTSTVLCQTKFAPGVLEQLPVGFSYAALDGENAGEILSAQDVTVDGTLLSCRIAGLRPDGVYSVYAYVSVSGRVMQSPVVAFVAGNGGDDPAPDPDPDPDPTPEPDPTPPAGGAKYAGWAELPTEQANPDFYYAYHICPDAYVGKTTQKMRNYSVCYSARYRCPVWVAAPMHKGYTGESGRGKNYVNDPSILCTQNSDYDFSSTNLTRGHLLGSGDRTISRAVNDQVFYKSNIGPQLEKGFNQGGGLWNNCESWVDSQWTNQADTTYQILGCYWENESKTINGTTVPTHYYKVLLRTKNHVNKWVSNCSREELQCIAVFFPHNSSNGGTTQSQYVSKGFVMKVADLEKKVGQTFFPNVPNAPKDTYNALDWGL